MSDSDKEHAQYFYNNSSLFRIKNLLILMKKSTKLITVDKKIDLKKLSIFKKNV